MTALSPASVSHIIQLWESLFRTTIAICTFGGSITFQVIFQQVDGQPVDADDGNRFRFDYKDSRSFLAGSWAAFLLALAISCIAAVVLTIRRQEIVEGFKPQVPRGWALFTVIAGLLAVEGLIGAFFVSSLAVTAYSNKTGWATAGFTGLCAVGTETRRRSSAGYQHNQHLRVNHTNKSVVVHAVGDNILATIRAAISKARLKYQSIRSKAEEPRRPQNHEENPERQEMVARSRAQVSREIQQALGKQFGGGRHGYYSEGLENMKKQNPVWTSRGEQTIPGAEPSTTARSQAGAEVGAPTEDTGDSKQTSSAAKVENTISQDGANSGPSAARAGP
ncbi:hypothetical protein DL771_008000 [Monosporascus sp. 5C6A]|nr:hypothetical protein DL771_008000 [Monosporascus sp. 5C6A]